MQGGNGKVIITFTDPTIMPTLSVIDASVYLGPEMMEAIMPAPVVASLARAAAPCECEILLFRAPDPDQPLPRPLSPELLLLYRGGDARSGGYRYSHAAVDCCQDQGVAKINKDGTRYVDRSYVGSTRSQMT